MRLPELAAALGAELVSPKGLSDLSAIDITGVAAHAHAATRDLVFAESESALTTADASCAGAIISSHILVGDSTSKPMLLADHPKLAFARAAELLRTEPERQGIHPSATIAATVTLGQGVFIGANVVLEDGAVIGAYSRIDAGAAIGAGVRMGGRCHLYPRVVVYPGTQLGARVIVHAGAVLGSDGFGYVRDHATGEYTKFPQQGRLVIEDDVEIGANTTIDRGALEETRIGRGAKLDNLIHLGHNVSVGRNVVIAAQTGVSGSSSIGDGAIVGGQVGMGEHAEIGAGVILGGQAGILPGKRVHGPGMVFWGTPARPIKEYLRELATLARLARRPK
jgi:UDP-3-O-[3-hydroxymyristoyl] glucosamine N-acyltransferase